MSEETSRHQGSVILTSEFASVEIVPDFAANGPRLRVENRQNGRAIYLDPLELATLTWLEHDDLGPFMDPSTMGWSNIPPDSDEAV